MWRLFKLIFWLLAFVYLTMLQKRLDARGGAGREAPAVSVAENLFQREMRSREWVQEGLDQTSPRGGK